MQNHDAHVAIHCHCFSIRSHHLSNFVTMRSHQKIRQMPTVTQRQRQQNAKYLNCDAGQLM